jgi:pyruvate dehydrogenase E1 component beta subunit
MSYREAINEALRLEMRRDPTVLIMGEDVTGASQSSDPSQLDAWGGVLGVTKGLVHEFGRERVRDTPITESAFVGAGVGAAATGMRPVVELMFIGFLGVCLDQITNQAAKMRYMFGGKAKIPLVIRTMVGAGFRAAAQHSDSMYSTFCTFLA